MLYFTRSAVAIAALVMLAPVSAQESTDIVFRSDVSLIRVDAQVVDRGNRAITGLHKEDFLLYEQGHQQEIRNFAQEDLPVDVLLLLDVSGSMQPHVERIASAAHDALLALGKDDRVGVMVFDRATRLRLPLRANRREVEMELDNVVRQETFDGGTDITRALLDAARYIGRDGRRDARRAIVIVTDDRTERGRDEAAVGRALTNANAVLMAMLAPDMVSRGRMGGGGGMGGGWPTGPSIGGPLGGIILGRRGPMGGGRFPGGGGRFPGSSGPEMQSAGTAEIARRSGGDSVRVDDSAALENTLARIRQRYALHFNLPAGVKPGEEREIEVALSDAARRRYPGAEVRYRRSYISDTGGPETDPVVVSQTTAAPEPVRTEEDSDAGLKHRRRGVSDVGGGSPQGPLTPPQSGSSTGTGGWRRTDEPERVPATQAPPAPSSSTAATSTQPQQEEKPRRGWRRVKPGEEP